MQNKLERIKKYSDLEKRTWDQVFLSEIKNTSNKKFSSYWWEYYYDQLTTCITSIVDNSSNLKVLEAGSGSGKATFLSFPKSRITLLDISSNALTAAKKLALAYSIKNVTYIEGNMFSMPFNDSLFDLVWNIGTVEHYDEDLVHDMLSEMLRVAKPKAFVAIAIPNFKSMPIKKAKILSAPILNRVFKFLPGYRLATEKSYTPQDIERIFKLVTNKDGSELVNIKTFFLGSPLFVGTPKPLINFVSRFEYMVEKRKFLILIIANKS